VILLTPQRHPRTSLSASDPHNRVIAHSCAHIDRLRPHHAPCFGAVLPNTCRSTWNGDTEITDDRGYLCARADVDPMTGCCDGGEQFACSSCRTGDADADDCCTTHARCVTCCMGPASGVERWWETFTPLRDQATFQWEDRFQFCNYRCRVHSRSTAHENDYIERSHVHCFSPDARPRDPSLAGPPLPDGVEMVAGAFGKGCNQVCPGGRVSASGMEHVNSCNELSRAFECESGCLATDEAWAPGYVDELTHKNFQPGTCMVRRGDGVDGGASRANVKRLCACE